MTEISIEEVKAQLRILDDSEDSQLELLLESAVEMLKGHTGLDDSVVRSKGDLKTALLILVSDFYWNRDYQTSNKYHNNLVDRIIENNRVNFVGGTYGNNDGNVQQESIIHKDATDSN